MTRFHSISKVRSSMLLMARGKHCVLLFACLTLCTGCANQPETHGTWSGYVVDQTFYGNGDSVYKVATMKLTDGTPLPPSLGDSLVLVRSPDTVIDASAITPRTLIHVTGNALVTGVTDGKGQTVTIVKGATSRMNVEVTPAIEVETITDANGNRIEPKAAGG